MVSAALSCVKLPIGTSLTIFAGGIAYNINIENYRLRISHLLFLQNIGIMAVYVKAIPTLRGAVADRFEKMSEENIRRRASFNFSKEAANSYAILRKKTVKK